jgi:ABC-type multidrug transport system ATPase subunit
VARILGREVRRDDPTIQSRMGVVFEEKNVYETLSAVENLRFFASLFGIRDLDALGLLERVGLADRAKDRVSSYSKGMRQRLMVARALVNGPTCSSSTSRPTASTQSRRRSIRGIIREEVERGAAVLLTTHDMWEADELSDRVAFINEGQIHAIDTPENLKLHHGKRAVRVRRRQDGKVREDVIDARR